MILTTTLKDLRKAGACIKGYNKLVCSLSGKTFNHNKETYIRFKHVGEIPLEYIINSNGVEDAIWSLRASNCTDKDARLFAVWCARQVEHLLTDNRSRNAIDVAEQFANGLATNEELAAARAAAWAAAWDAEWGAAWDAAWAAARAAAGDAARAAEDASRDAQKEMFIKMCNGQAQWQVKE